MMCGGICAVCRVLTVKNASRWLEKRLLCFYWVPSLEYDLELNPIFFKLYFIGDQAPFDQT